MKLVQNGSMIDGTPIYAEEEFVETDHPRDNDGQFSNKNEEDSKIFNHQENRNKLSNIFPNSKNVLVYDGSAEVIFDNILNNEDMKNKITDELQKMGYTSLYSETDNDGTLHVRGYEKSKLDSDLKSYKLDIVEDFEKAVDMKQSKHGDYLGSTRQVYGSYWDSTRQVLKEMLLRKGFHHSRVSTLTSTQLTDKMAKLRTKHLTGVLVALDGRKHKHQTKFRLQKKDSSYIFNRINEIIKNETSKSSEKLVQTENKINGMSVFTEAEFKEDDHPRDDDGQFANKGNDKKTDKKYHGTINNRYSGSTTPMDIQSDEYMYLKTDGGEDIEFRKDDSIDDLISRYDMYHSEDWKNPGRVKLKRDENDLEYYIYQNKDSFSIDSEGREWPVKFRSMKQLSYDMLKRNINSFSAAGFKGFNIDSVREMNKLGIPFHIYDELEKDGKIKIERPSKRKMILSLPKKSTEEFVEDDHPRDNDGQFSNKDGSSGSGSDKKEKYGKDAMKRAADNERRKEEENKREGEKQEKEVKELFPNSTDVYFNDDSIHFQLDTESENENIKEELREKLKNTDYILHSSWYSNYSNPPYYSIHIQKKGYQPNRLDELAELRASKLDTVEDFTEAIQLQINDHNKHEHRGKNTYWYSLSEVFNVMINRAGLDGVEVFDMTMSGGNGRIKGMGSMYSSGVMVVLRPRERYNKGKFIFRSTDMEKNFDKITKIISDNTKSSEKLVQTEGKINGMKVFTEAEFKEEEHPRDEGGQFSEKGNGSDKKEEKYGEDAIKRAIDNEEKKKEENEKNKKEQLYELQNIFPTAKKLNSYGNALFIPIKKDEYDETYNRVDKLLDENGFKMDGFASKYTGDDDSLYFEFRAKKDGYEPKKLDPLAVLKATQLETPDDFKKAIDYNPIKEYYDVFWEKTAHVVDEKIKRNGINVETSTLQSDGGPVRLSRFAGVITRSKGVMMVINPDTDNQKKYMIRNTDLSKYENIFNKVNNIIEKHKPDPDKLNKIGEVYMKKNGKIISVPVWSKKDFKHFSNLTLKSIEFDEDKHSRDQDGKFSEKEGGGIQKDLDRINKQTQSADDKYSDFVNGEIVPKWKKSVQELGDELDIIKKKQMPIWSKLQKEKTGHFENGDFDSPEVKKLARGIYNAKKAITDAENRIPSIRHGRLVEQQKILKEQYKKLDRDSERSKLLSGKIDDLNYAIHEAKFESDNREYYRDYSKQGSSEFDESDHPRGQPENSGQFVEKGSGSSGGSNNDKKTTKSGSKQKRGTDELYSLMKKSYDPWADPDYKLKTFIRIFEPKNEMKTLQSEALIGKWKKEWDKYGKIFHDEDGHVDIERIYEKIEQLAIKRKDTKTIKLVDNLKMGADTYNDFMEEVHSSDKKLNRVLTLKEAVQIAKEGKFKEVMGEYGRKTGNPEHGNNKSKSFTYMDNHNFKTHSSIQMSIDKDELPFEILRANWKPFSRKNLKFGVSFDGAEMQMEARLITTKPLKIPEKTMKNIEMTIGKDAVVDDESLAILASKFKIVDLREKGMEATEVRNDDLLLRMVRMRMNGNNLMYKDGVPRDWIIATIQSWGQGLEDGDVDNAIREGILVDAGKNLIGQQIYKPAE